MEMELAVYLPKTLLCDSIYQLVVTAQHQQSGGQSHGDAQRVRTDRYPVLQVETHVICHDLNDQISKETVHSGVSSDRWFCQTFKIHLELGLEPLGPGINQCSHSGGAQIQTRKVPIKTNLSC